MTELRELKKKMQELIHIKKIYIFQNSVRNISKITFSISGCYQISAINCDSYCDTLSSCSVVPSSASRMIFLQYLDLSDCPRIVDAGLRMIVKNSPHLRNIFLRRCLNLTGIVDISGVIALPNV